jgi:hypothetical protein
VSTDKKEGPHLILASPQTHQRKIGVLFFIYFSLAYQPPASGTESTSLLEQTSISNQPNEKAAFWKQ